MKNACLNIFFVFAQKMKSGFRSDFMLEFMCLYIHTYIM